MPLYKRQIHFRPGDNLTLTWECVEADGPMAAALADLDSDIFAHVNTLVIYIATIEEGNRHLNSMPITVTQYEVKVSLNGAKRLTVAEWGDAR